MNYRELNQILLVNDDTGFLRHLVKLANQKKQPLTPIFIARQYGLNPHVPSQPQSQPHQKDDPLVLEFYRDYLAYSRSLGAAIQDGYVDIDIKRVSYGHYDFHGEYSFKGHPLFSCEDSHSGGYPTIYKDRKTSAGHFDIVNAECPDNNPLNDETYITSEKKDLEDGLYPQSQLITQQEELIQQFQASLQNSYYPRCVELQIWMDEEGLWDYYRQNLRFLQLNRSPQDLGEKDQKLIEYMVLMKKLPSDLVYQGRALSEEQAEKKMEGLKNDLENLKQELEKYQQRLELIAQYFPYL